MRPATIRRLLVFGVCLAGVGCLYLLPSIAGSPGRSVPSPSEQDAATAPATTTLVSATSPYTAPTPGEALTFSHGTPSTPPTGTSTSHQRGDPDDRRTSPGGTGPGITAVEPGQDENPPAAVGRLSVTGATPERLRISWPEAEDDVGVISYSVRLNGFPVLATQETRATLAWFNDSDTHVIQVRALDAAGNEGPSSPTLLVRRPAPTEPPSAPPTTPGQPTPTSKPAASLTPTEDADALPDTDHAASTPDHREEEGGTEEDGS